ncbi:helix-turn-helix transcriptional regulator [Macrococcus equi]|uniref:helix-turn-helix transcriptional regulator n=1 Tax=Macrococcus equi TaxID=3395462 RepID=UPI0039BDE81B
MNIKEIINYIKSAPIEELTLENISLKFHYNPTYFSRKFKETTGISYRKYLELLKIQRGKKLLLNKEDKIVQVSLDSGFKFSNNFSKSFKSQTGILPKNYFSISKQCYKLIKLLFNLNFDYYIKDSRIMTNNLLFVDLIFPEKNIDCINFVGLFKEPVPNTIPIIGLATRRKTSLILDKIPNGEYYLLACEIRKDQSFNNVFMMEDNFRAKYQKKIIFEGDNNYYISLDMREAIPEDPPITINLLKLLHDIIKR